MSQVKFAEKVLFWLMVVFVSLTIGGLLLAATSFICAGFR